MEKLRLRQCCCCATLRTGTLIIAGLCVFGSILSIITIFAYKEMNIQNLQGITSLMDMDHTSAVIFSVFYNIISIITAAILFLGVQKNNWSMFLPWLFFYAFAIVLSIINLILITTGPLSKHVDKTSFGAFIFGGILGLMLGIYIWLVPYSYGKTIKEESKRGLYSMDQPRDDAI